VLKSSKNQKSMVEFTAEFNRNDSMGKS